MTLEDALQFGCLPRPLGVHPETELPLVAGLGRFGPYIKHGDKFVSIKDMDVILKGSLDEVVQALAAKAQAPSRFRRPAGTGSPASRTQKTVSKPKAPTRATASKKSASKAPAKASSKSKSGSQA